MQKFSKAELLKYRFPSVDLQKKYKVLNYVLIALMFAVACSRLLLAVQLLDFLDVGIPSFLLLSFFNTAMLVLMVWIIVWFWKFDVRGYQATLFLLVPTIFSTLREPDVVTIIGVGIFAVITVFLKKKLFPNLGLFAAAPKKTK